MARLLGPDAGSRYAYLQDGSPAANATGVVYANSAATVLADVRAYDGSETPGAVILGSQVATDEYGQLELFWFPDGVDRVWARIGADGPVWLVDADNNRRIDKLESDRVFNVRAYGATGDAVTDDATAILAAVEAARVARGTVYFPGGTYRTSQTIPIYSSIDYVGSGVGASVVKLANGANKDLFATDQFTTLFAGSTQGGPLHWSLRGLTLDGNGANQTAASWPLSTYGKCFQVSEVEITAGWSGGWRSRWGTGGDDMEAQVSNFKIHHNLNGPGLDWQGPHDSQFVNGQVFEQDGQYGIHTYGNAGGEQFTSVHVWHFHTVGWYVEQTAKMVNCVGEGAQVNVWLAANGCIWDGEVFGTNGTGEYTPETGVRIGSAGNAKWGNVVRGVSWNWAATDLPIDYAGDNGCQVDVTVRANAATALTTGTPSAKSQMNVLCVDTPVLSVTPELTLLRALGYQDGAVETASRVVDGSYTAVSGRINLSYLTAYRTQTISQLGAVSRNTAVVGLTAARWGLYTVAANGDLTLVARTAQNTTTAYGATFTEYNTALNTTGGYPASYTLVQGRRYALAQIVTFTTTAPVLRGYAGNAPGSLVGRAPRLTGLVGAQTDLLTTISAGTVANDGNAVYLYGLA